MCLHIQSRCCFGLFHFSLDFIYNSPLLSHFILPWADLFMFTVTILLSGKSESSWENHKNKNKQVWLLFLLPCSHLCHLFQIKNTWSNPASLSEVDVTKCCLRKLGFVKFTKLLIWNMLLSIIFWLNTDYFPFQFPGILLFGLLGNPPARICGWRTKFPPSPSSFPQNRKTERRYVLSWPGGNLYF